MKALDLDTINEILKPQPIQTEEHANRQKGPLRFYDTEMRCTSRRCGSPTYIKVSGVAKCKTHALHDLNDIILRLEERMRAGGIY